MAPGIPSRPAAADVSSPPLDHGAGPHAVYGAAAAVPPAAAAGAGPEAAAAGPDEEHVEIEKSNVLILGPTGCGEADGDYRWLSSLPPNSGSCCQASTELLVPSCCCLC